MEIGFFSSFVIKPPHHGESCSKQRQAWTEKTRPGWNTLQIGMSGRNSISDHITKMAGCTDVKIIHCQQSFFFIITNTIWSNGCSPWNKYIYLIAALRRNQEYFNCTTSGGTKEVAHRPHPNQLKRVTTLYITTVWILVRGLAPWTIFSHKSTRNNKVVLHIVWTLNLERSIYHTQCIFSVLGVSQLETTTIFKASDITRPGFWIPGWNSSH